MLLLRLEKMKGAGYFKYLLIFYFFKRPCNLSVIMNVTRSLVCGKA